jgi:hypothetical protein
MRAFLIPLLLVALVSGQQASKCQVCSRVRQCDPVLFNDGNIDPIFDALVQQLDLKEYPDVISRTQDAKNAYYSFGWPGRFFLATVDLQTG